MTGCHSARQSGRADEKTGRGGVHGVMVADHCADMAGQASRIGHHALWPASAANPGLKRTRLDNAFTVPDCDGISSPERRD
jgi:hypothetical protein